MVKQRSGWERRGLGSRGCWGDGGGEGEGGEEEREEEGGGGVAFV